jgi:predicted  nucleic acid-binding Zn-ribbon protein
MAARGHGAIIMEYLGAQAFEITRLKAMLEEREHELEQLKLQVSNQTKAECEPSPPTA